MKTGILSFILSIAACVALTSCNDDTWTPGTTAAGNGEGLVSLASIDVDVDNDVAVVSRAEVSTDAFLVGINSTDGSVKRSYTYGSMPEVITLPAGEYTVSVKSHDVKDAEWDAPYYVGSADFSVTTGQITEIGTVFCKFSNIKVTVKYTKELAEYLDENAHVTVTTNDHGSLDFTATETRSGYFAALEGSSTLVAEFTANIKGNVINSIQTFTDVTAGKHYIITFSIKNGTATLPDESGTITLPGLTVDANIEHENLNGTAPVEDDNKGESVERPGNEDWDDDNNTDPVTPTPPSTQAITITPDEKCKNLNLDGGVNPVVDGDTYIINIHADNGIENLKVNIQSTNDGFIEAAGEMLPMEFDLAHLDDTLYENLKSIGLEGNAAVLNQTDVPFDITELVPMLLIYEGTHTFVISVTDKEGNSLSKSLILQAE